MADSPVANGARIAHGYTITELDEMARRAALSSAWSRRPIPELIDIARFAIVEHLYATDEPAQGWALVNIGERAVQHYVHDDARHWGVYASGRHGAGSPRRLYWRYWSPASHRTPTPEDLIVDPLALAQIWPRLTPMSRTVLLALAEHDDYAAAAASLGKGYQLFHAQVCIARRRFFELWHEGEAPSRVWARDTRKLRAKEGNIMGNIIRRRARRRSAR